MDRGGDQSAELFDCERPEEPLARGLDPVNEQMERMLGFDFEKIDVGRLVPTLGNTYSGSSPLGLTAVLDVANPGDRVLMCSYGSGAGSDAFVFTVRDRVRKVRDLAPKTRWLLDENVSYL